MQISDSIREKYNLRKELSGCISTKNNRGAQVSTPTPLLQHWIASYDGTRPLLDIGCAYGINIMEALKLDIPTIALDMTQIHLDVLKEVADEAYCSGKLICLLGSLPNNLPVPDESVSGILVSEVLHFLTGQQIAEALNTIHSKVRKGGKLVIAMSSIYYFVGIDDAFVEDFFERLGKGEKWPGPRYFTGESVVKVQKAAADRGVDFYEPSGIPEFTNHCILSQVTAEVEKAGFEILKAEEGRHPGYSAGNDKSPRACIQILAKK